MKTSNTTQSQGASELNVMLAAEALISASHSIAKLSQVKQWAPNTITFKRGLNRKESAEYIGVGTTKFDQLVSQRRMPKPFQIDGRRVWDVRLLDDAFVDLGTDAHAMTNPWDR